MERKKEQNINHVINAIFNQYGLTGRMKEMRIINGWRDIAGDAIANATSKIDIYNRVLFLKISSAALRNELLMQRSNIKDIVNKRACEIIIDDVVIN